MSRPTIEVSNGCAVRRYMQPAAVARLAVVLALSIAVGAQARAQDLEHYLRIRHQYHVSHASSLDGLKDANAGQVLELEGTVNGSFRAGPTTTLLLDHPGGDAQEIETDFVPDWLVSSNIAARLLVKTVRPDESTPLRVVLLAAAKDVDISKREGAASPKPAPSHPAKNSVPSRTAGRGDGALYGSIGRGGSRLERQEVRSMDRVLQKYADFVRFQNPRLTNAEAMVVARNIIGRCMDYSIDPRLVVAMVSVESGFDPLSVSNKGAIGLGQLMPGTAEWMGISNSYNVEENIYAMVKLLYTLRAMFMKESSDAVEMWEKTIAAYNAGDGAVRRSHGIPPFPATQAYVRHVCRLWMQLGGDPHKVALDQ